MSATDSDNSIDWLATDTEDNDSERESDCSAERRHAEAPPPRPRPSSSSSSSSSPRLGPSDSSSSSSSCRRRGGEVKGGEWNEVREASARGSPRETHAAAASAAAAIGLCKTGDKASGFNSQPALKKRPRSSVEKEDEEEEGSKGRQLISSMSERDRVFSRKCTELQCYIHPLSLILNGLRSGRYSERLSSFQESVAMDRIQRIMGVLQNPCMGEKYINIILKMEVMLKSWFPNVKLREHVSATPPESDDVPTKKLKLSPMTSTTTTAAVSPVTVSDPPAAAAAAAAAAKSLSVTDLSPGGAYSANNLKWLHTSPICSPAAEQAQAGPRHLLPPRDLTQDSAVSSSTDAHTKTDSAPSRPPAPPGKIINAPCLERLLKSTESIITRKETRGLMDSSWS